MGFLKIALVLIACAALGGCELLFDAVPMESAGIGALESEGAMGAEALPPGDAGASGGIGLAAISDDIAEVADGIPLTPRMEGELSDILRRWTNDGAEIGRVLIERDGVLRANGYAVARLESEGTLYASNGLELGRFNAADGRLYEFLRDGSKRPIAELRGFTAENGVDLYLDPFGQTVVRILKPSSLIEVVGVENGRYLVRLVNGRLGWVPGEAVVWLALLGLHQTAHHCPQIGDGIVAETSGERIYFTRCKEQDGQFILSTPDGSLDVPQARVAFVLSGDGVSRFRRNTPRYVVAYNGQTRFRIPSDSEFTQRPAGAQNPFGAAGQSAGEPPNPFTNRGR
jgi:hypothetical protein